LKTFLEGEGVKGGAGIGMPAELSGWQAQE